MADNRSRSHERAEVNRSVRTAVRRFGVSGGHDETWDFLCECGVADCKEWVNLTLVGYEALRRREEPIVAPGHAVTTAERVRRKARKLVGDAKALRAQADTQNRRARGGESADGE